MAASMRNPVVVILGATGTGKTKLSLELAKLFNGEIISADAMQVYKGLDIITNKATAEERNICPHHMIDYISPLKDNSTVVDYRNQTVPIVDSLLKRDKMPVIVGGTNYYIEAVLWKHLVNPEDVKRASTLLQEGKAKIPNLEETVISQHDGDNSVVKSTSFDDSNNKKTGVIKNKTEAVESVIDDTDDATHESCEVDGNGTVDCNSLGDSGRGDSDDGTSEAGTDEADTVQRARRARYESLTSQELYQRLWEVDPETANRIHPKDRRKIMRAIEVYDQHGIPRSVVYKAQHTELSDNALSGPLRYPDTCIFWLQCEKEVLNQRLDDRVDKMIEMGLVEELTQFHKQYNEDRLKQGKDAVYTTGIFQSIGFKEFHEYLILDDDERHTEKGKQLLEQGIENLKVATRKYASYQNRWVKKRLLKRPCKDSVPPVYGLDCTDVSRWEELVSTPATTILTALRKGDESPIPPLPQDVEDVSEFIYNECKTCDIVTVTKHTWQIHISSRRHKKRSQHLRNLQKKLTSNLDIYIQQKQRLQATQKDSSLPTTKEVISSQAKVKDIDSKTLKIEEDSSGKSNITDASLQTNTTDRSLEIKENS